MTNWTKPKFDRHAFDNKRSRAVSKTTCIAFSDFERMSIMKRQKQQERRLPTPKWAVRDIWLRELLVVHLEERFYIKPSPEQTLKERLAVVRYAADLQASRKRVLLTDWLTDYHSMVTKGQEVLTDEEAIATFCALKHINGQLPINADIAREYLANKRAYDLEVQIQNIDTDLVLTVRGHAETLAAIVYMYYRLGWDSVTVAEQLGLKPPHIRQTLARLHATWTQKLKHKYQENEQIVIEEPFAEIFEGGL